VSPEGLRAIIQARGAAAAVLQRRVSAGGGTVAAMAGTEEIPDHGEGQAAPAGAVSPSPGTNTGPS